jgi:hypothetical protein
VQWYGLIVDIWTESYEDDVELRKNIFDCYFSTKVRAKEALIYIAYTETN